MRRIGIPFVGCPFHFRSFAEWSETTQPVIAEIEGGEATPTTTASGKIS
jgi:hypothetical protein